MARIEKYSTGIVGVIKHNLREFKDGKCPTNSEVDPTRIKDNYSIIQRGETTAEIEAYRKSLMKEIFHYNRKNIIRVNEVICTLPADCPPEQEQLFFEESYKYILSTLPMGEKCVLLCTIHEDEGRILKDGKTVVQGQKHMHVMYVPAVPDLKHDGYDYRLCSDELTKRAILKQWHPNYQKWLDDAGVQATVANGATNGRGISVKALKEITQETGYSLDELMAIEKENTKLHEVLKEKDIEVAALMDALAEKDSLITEQQLQINDKDSYITELKAEIRTKDVQIYESKDIDSATFKDNEILKQELKSSKEPFQNLKNCAQQIIAEKNTQIVEKDRTIQAKDNTISAITNENESLKNKVAEMEAMYKQKEAELLQEQECTKELEANQKTTVKEWGIDSGWGYANWMGHQFS